MAGRGQKLSEEELLGLTQSLQMQQQAQALMLEAYAHSFKACTSAPYTAPKLSVKEKGCITNAVMNFIEGRMVLNNALNKSGE